MFQICVLTYIALNTGKPVDLRNKPDKLSSELGASIRHSHDSYRLNEPGINKEIGTRSFKYSAPKLFNSLPRSTKNSEKRIKNIRYLFSECYDLDTKTVTDTYYI